MTIIAEQRRIPASWLHRFSHPRLAISQLRPWVGPSPIGMAEHLHLSHGGAIREGPDLCHKVLREGRHLDPVARDHKRFLLRHQRRGGVLDPGGDGRKAGPESHGREGQR